MFKRFHREFYLLPRGEQRALILLSLLLILSLIFRITVKLIPEREPEGLDEFKQEAAMLMAALAEADSLKHLQKDSFKLRSRDLPVRTYPSFKRSEHIYKIQPLDINRADSAALLPLPGIGPVFAGRIIKYRDLLGGFVSIDQLGEVYGISGKTVQMIRSLVYIDSTAVRRIRVDSASFRELLRHPYLEYENVRALLSYRDFIGNIETFSDLQENHILSDSILQRLKCYLDL